MKFTNTIALILGSCIVPACIPVWEEPNWGHYQVFIDNRFNQSDTAVIKAALIDWETATEGYVTFELTTDWSQDDNFILIHPATSEELGQRYTENNGGGDVPKHILGVTTTSGTHGDVALATNQSDGSFVEAAHHELGHALGLHHVLDTNQIMYPSTSVRVNDVTCGDLQQFCVLWGCDADKMDICSSVGDSKVDS